MHGVNRSCSRQKSFTFSEPVGPRSSGELRAKLIWGKLRRTPSDARRPVHHGQPETQMPGRRGPSEETVRTLRARPSAASQGWFVYLLSFVWMLMTVGTLNLTSVQVAHEEPISSADPATSTTEADIGARVLASLAEIGSCGDTFLFTSESDHERWDCEVELEDEESDPDALGDCTDNRWASAVPKKSMYLSGTSTSTGQDIGCTGLARGPPHWS